MNTPSLSRFLSIIAGIKYRNWSFRLDHAGGVPFLQVRIPFRNVGNDSVEILSCRKWMLSERMTESEIVQTALMAVLAAEEHEAREQFTYRGQAIFGPHYSVDRLIKLCKEGSTALDVRPEPGAEIAGVIG